MLKKEEKFESDVRKIRSSFSTRSEAGQAAIKIAQDFFNRTMVAIEDLKASIRQKAVISGVFTTDNGESGSARTFDFPGVSVGHVAIAVVCDQGAVPVTVDAITCGGGEVTVEFSGDPSTDHKVVVQVSRPLINN